MTIYCKRKFYLCYTNIRNPTLGSLYIYVQYCTAVLLHMYLLFTYIHRSTRIYRHSVLRIFYSFYLHARSKLTSITSKSNHTIISNVQYFLDKYVFLKNFLAKFLHLTQDVKKRHLNFFFQREELHLNISFNFRQNVRGLHWDTFMPAFIKASHPKKRPCSLSAFAPPPPLWQHMR